MSASTGQRIEDIAHDLFTILTQISLSTQSAQRRGLELKELEYLTLAILQSHDTMIVGDIQRRLGILPAQMSRIIRSLENRQPPLIACQINPRDKRKVDVRLSAAGSRALLDYQEARVARLARFLQTLSEDEQEDLVRLMQRLADAFERSQPMGRMAESSR